MLTCYHCYHFRLLYAAALALAGIHKKVSFQVLYTKELLDHDGDIISQERVRANRQGRADQQRVRCGKRGLCNSRTDLLYPPLGAVAL